MDNRIKAVIFDWAGTMVDYGCFAPVHAFLQTFEQAGVPIRMEEARAPMGLLKRDHIRAILEMERVGREWLAAYGLRPTESDADHLYASFEEKLMESLEQYTNPIPGALDAVDRLRRSGIRIGSTTGYTKAMMDVVAEGARSKGYAPDFIICSDEVKAGRPYPYMIFRNLYELEVFPPKTAIKVGDTLSDIAEALHAGVWSVAVIRGSSELGLTEAEAEQMPHELLQGKMDNVRMAFQSAGAHIVIESIDELPDAVQQIELRLQSAVDEGERYEPIS